MDRKQQNLRRAAAQAFMESLDQLQDVLGTETSSAASPATSKPVRQHSEASPQPDLAAFEQAAVDIERLMQNQSQEA